MALTGLGLGIVQNQSQQLSAASSYQPAAQEPHKTEKSLAPPAPIVGGPVQSESAEGVPSDADCTPERDRNDIGCRDLKAQETMAVAAIAQIVLTGFGLFLIFGTLIYTRDAATAARGAVNEAEKATRAAEAAVAETRRIGEAQVRAYVHALNPTVFNFRVGLSPYITYRAKNHGQTPANNFRQTTTWRIVTDPQTYKVRFGENVRSKGVADMAAGEFFQQTTTLPVLTQEHYDLLIANRVYLLFVGVIRYRDVFGRWRRTVFRWYMDIRTLGDDDTVAMSNCAKNNRSS